MILQNVANQPKTTWANAALLIMYAWDMCSADHRFDSVTLDERVNSAGYEIVGFIIGNDAVLSAAQIPDGLRKFQVTVGVASDFRRYGYLARSKSDTSQFVAVLRGTAGAEEWIDDAIFVTKSVPGIPGRVEGGFHSIFSSMRYMPIEQSSANVDDNGDALNPGLELVEALVGVVGGGKVCVMGHSLGASLATLLAYSLSQTTLAARMSGLFFAVPKTGDQDFAVAFDQSVKDYIALNYEKDLVPRIPRFDITHFDVYRALPNTRILTDVNAASALNPNSAPCWHHLICYVAILDKATFNQTMSAGLPPNTSDNQSCAACVLA